MKPAKRKKRKAAAAKSAKSLPGQAEERGVLAATVLWMLTLLCSLAGDLGGIACFAFARLWPAPPGQPPLMQMMARSLLLVALVTGVLCLLLTPLVWRLRRIKPPLAIVLVAVLVGVTPIVTLVVLNWLS